MSLFTVLLLSLVMHCDAYHLYRLLPKCNLDRSLRRVNPTFSRFCPSKTNVLLSLSHFCTHESAKENETVESLEHDSRMPRLVGPLDIPGASLALQTDGREDDKNNTSPVQLFSRLPPFLIEDWNVLFYDILLIVNLTVSISFWVIHRYDVSYIGRALNEGCLLSLLWIGAGLWNGSFLYTSVDGHYLPPTKGPTTAEAPSNQSHRPGMDSGGPVAAGLLAFHTFINTINLRLLFALIVALVEHRPALSSGTELLVPLELGYGLILMILWRALHSNFVLR